jgi:protein gp37
MDAGSLESLNRLYQGQPWMQVCYAERMSIRLKAMGQPDYSQGFDRVCMNVRSIFH